MTRDYGRVKPGFWDNPELKACALATKAVGTYLLTSSHTNAIGCFKVPSAYMMDDLRADAESLQTALAELRGAGFVAWCERMPWLWIPNYLKHNAPENPNVWRKCVKELQSLPGEISAAGAIAEQLQRIGREPRMSNPLSKTRVTEEEIASLEPYRNRIEALAKASRPLPVPCPTPEPNHDLTTPSLRSGSAAPEKALAPAGPTFIELPTNRENKPVPVSEAKVLEYEKTYPGANVRQELREMRQWLIDNRERRKTAGGMMKFVNAWLAKEQDKSSKPNGFRKEGEHEKLARVSADLIRESRERGGDNRADQCAEPELSPPADDRGPITGVAASVLPRFGGTH